MPSVKREILSLAPAYPGCRAVFLEPDDPTQSFEEAIICWALVRETRDDPEAVRLGLQVTQDILPVTACARHTSETGTSVVTSENFVGVAIPGQTKEQLVERFRRGIAIENAMASKSLGEA
jgi:hypothetical protein